MSLVTLCIAAALVGTNPSEAGPSPDPDAIAAYRRAAAVAGRDADAHVKLALWCEARGLEAERLQHLAVAVLADPSHALARGLLGSLREADSWGTPEAIAARIKKDASLAALLAEYNQRREGMKDTPAAHWELASWCDRNGLKPEAVAHYTAVTRLSPDRADAWKRLGFVRSRGRWMKPEQVAAEAAQRKQQLEANAKWQPKLLNLRVRMAEKAQRPGAEAELAKVDDPYAVPAVWRVFGRSRPEHQKVAVQLLGQIDAPSAAGPLLALAVWANDPEIRQAASETVFRRDRREWLGQLVAQVRTPVEYQILANEGIGGAKAIRVEGEAFILNRVYTAPGQPPTFARRWPAMGGGQWTISRAPTPDVLAASRVSRDVLSGPSEVAGGVTPVGVAAEPALTARVARDTDLALSLMANSRRGNGIREDRNANRYKQAVALNEIQFQNDLASLEANNLTARQINDRILPLLEAATGQDLGDDRLAWSKWWTEQQGYSFRPPEKVTYYQRAPDTTPSYETPSSSCFGRGTLVRTIDGPRAIETLRIGDRVLSQDTTSGALSFQPVLVVYHNPPDETLRVQLEGEPAPVVTTPIHRFWKAGHGWVMARELQPGDRVRLVGGTARVAGVNRAGIQPVFNLEVAEGHSFFVGHRGALVHDYTLVEPVASPFDALPKLDVLAQRAE
jgi:hypothetical protein